MLVKNRLAYLSLLFWNLDASTPAWMIAMLVILFVLLAIAVVVIVFGGIKLRQNNIRFTPDGSPIYDYIRGGGRRAEQAHQLSTQLSNMSHNTSLDSGYQQQERAIRNHGSQEFGGGDAGQHAFGDLRLTSNPNGCRNHGFIASTNNGFPSAPSVATENYDVLEEHSPMTSSLAPASLSSQYFSFPATGSSDVGLQPMKVSEPARPVGYQTSMPENVNSAAVENGIEKMCRPRQHNEASGSVYFDDNTVV